MIGGMSQEVSSMKNLWRGLPKMVRLWAPPLIGIPAMLLLGFSFEVARFLLFTHHLFWMIGGILLINPVLATLLPDTPQKSKARRMRPLSVTKSRPPQANVRQRTTNQRPASAVERPAERPARLQQEKGAVDQKIGRLMK